MRQTLSASRIKTMTSCSWLYWSKYHLKLPDKTNDGALKGSIVHLVLECLGRKRHKKHYDLIVKKGSVGASKAVGKLIYKHAKAANLLSNEANLEDIYDMAFRGVVYDFFGTRLGKPSEVISEKEFELDIEERDISYKVKGFIDRLFIYKNKSIALIRDFKTNKKVYEGKEVTDNLQDYIYTLAVKKLYPDFKNIKMEFVFLKAMESSRSETGTWHIVGEDKSILEMSNKNQDELTGFEYELTSFQDYANQFSEDTAVSNLAFKQGMPKDGSFSGRLLCGFAKKPNELKKDGSPKWYCTYKFPFDYYSLINNKGELKRCYFTKEEALKRKEKGDKIKKNHYEGCPCHIPKKQPDFDFDFGFNSSNEKDDFDLDKF